MTGTILPNIAFIGRAGSGKTTAREYLEEAYGYERISFAAPLKVMAGTTDDRGLLQKLGHGVRLLHEDAWVNLLEHDLDTREYECNVTPFANDDTRYHNEAAALKGRGFVIVRVVASTLQRKDRLMLNGRLQSEDQLTHISETALDDFGSDYTIPNIDAPEELHARLDEIVNRERS